MGMVFGSSPSAIRLCADDEEKFSTSKENGEEGRENGEKIKNNGGLFGTQRGEGSENATKHNLSRVKSND